MDLAKKLLSLRLHKERANPSVQIMSNIRLTALVASVMAASSLGAQSPSDEPLIVTHITASGVNIIEMPPQLRQLLQFNPEQEPVETDEEGESGVQRTCSRVGYRVQVFSDNNQRTAKNEARSKSRSIGARFPQYKTYVSYTSPYWRLRVGDFRTQQEASAAADELRSAFPAYSKEIRVVRDRVNF